MERIVKKIKLIESESLGKSAVVLTFKLVTSDELGFVGGQYIILNSGLKNEEGKDIKRAYSIFSSDLKQDEFQVSVQNVNDRSVSGFLSRMEIGTELEYSGPWGKFVASPDWPLPGKILLVATHTGITAMTGILRSKKFIGRLNESHALWINGNDFLSVARIGEEIPLNDFKTYDAVNSNSLVDLLLSKLKEIGNPDNVFLSGEENLLQVCKEVLLGRGVSEQSIILEKFFKDDSLENNQEVCQKSQKPPETLKFIRFLNEFYRKKGLLTHARSKNWLKKL